MAESSAPQDSTSSKSSEAQGSPGSDDDTKRKFREALDRKTAKSSGRSDRKDVDGKQSRSHGPMENRREFRRKSG